MNNLYRELDALPYFRVLEGPTLPVVEMEGRQRIMLGSNNYLGLTGDERVRQGALDALNRYGTGLTGSRFLNGTIDLHVVLDSLGRLAHDLETSPAAQERAARERFGVIRNGELLYRLVPQQPPP